MDKDWKEIEMGEKCPYAYKVTIQLIKRLPNEFIRFFSKNYSFDKDYIQTDKIRQFLP